MDRPIKIKNTAINLNSNWTNSINEDIQHLQTQTLYSHKSVLQD